MSPRPLQGPSTAQLGSYTAKDLLSAAFARHTSTDNLSSRLNKLQVRDRPHTHSPISSSTGQHFVDTDNMEGVQAHADVETIFTTGLYHVLFYHRYGLPQELEYK